MSDTVARPVFTTCNPADGQSGKSYPGHSGEDAALKASRAAEAQRRWRRVALDERARPMRKAAERLRARRDELAAGGRTVVLAGHDAGPAQAAQFRLRHCIDELHGARAT